MKKKSISLTVIFTFTILMSLTIYAGTFDYQSYKPYTLNLLIDEFKDYEKRVGPGMAFNILKYKINTTLNEYPVPINKKEKAPLEVWGKLLNVENYYLKLFNHRMKMKKGDFTICLYIQDQLVPYLKKEIKIGQNVDFYLVFGSFNTDNRELTLLINEFQDTSENNTAKVEKPFFL